LRDLDPQASLSFSLYKVTEWEAELAEQRTVLQWFQAHGTQPLAKYVVTPPAVGLEVV